MAQKNCPYVLASHKSDVLQMRFSQTSVFHYMASVKISDFYPTPRTGLG